LLRITVDASASGGGQFCGIRQDLIATSLREFSDIGQPFSPKPSFLFGGQTDSGTPVTSNFVRMGHIIFVLEAGNAIFEFEATCRLFEACHTMWLAAEVAELAPPFAAAEADAVPWDCGRPMTSTC